MEESNQEEEPERNHKHTAVQSEPPKTNNTRRLPLQNSNVRRKIIRPWEDNEVKSKSPSPSTLTNGTAAITDSLPSLPKSSDVSSVTTAAEALVEMGTSTPPKQDMPESTDTPVQSKATLLMGAPVVPAADVIVDQDRLLALFERVIDATEKCTCEQMERLHATFDHLVFRHRMTIDRSELIEVSFLPVV